MIDPISITHSDSVSNSHSIVLTLFNDILNYSYSIVLIIDLYHSTISSMSQCIVIMIMVVMVIDDDGLFRLRMVYHSLYNKMENDSIIQDYFIIYSVS